MPESTLDPTPALGATRRGLLLETLRLATTSLVLLVLGSAPVALAQHDSKRGEKPASGASGLPRSDRPEDAELYFITPSDGDTVSSPVRVRFGLRNMGVAPAGVEKARTGHHHLLVDVELSRSDLPIPNDDRHRHFGGGETEVVLDLEPGRHTLQLVLGDHLHIPHDPPVVSERIEITVAEEADGADDAGKK